MIGGGLTRRAISLQLGMVNVFFVKRYGRNPKMTNDLGSNQFDCSAQAVQWDSTCKTTAGDAEVRMTPSAYLPARFNFTGEIK